MGNITDLYFTPDEERIHHHYTTLHNLMEHTTERRMRVHARHMMETILLEMSNQVDAYCRDDEMTTKLRMLDGRWVDAEVLSRNLHMLLSEVDIHAEYPLSYNIHGRKNWSSGRFTYQVTDGGIFLIERKP